MGSHAPIIIFGRKRVMKIRKIDKNDRLEILKGDLYAYSRWTNQDLPRSHLTAINPDEVLVAEIDGKIAAALQCFSFHQSVRGSVKAMGGLGGVWTYPEYRNQGCVKALIKSAFLEMRMQGIGVSMLTPFKESFYSSLGYAIANPTNEINIPVTSLSPYLKLPNSTTLTCDRLAATEAKDILSNFLYEHLRSQTLQPHNHGLVITNFTYEQWWHLHRHKLCVVIKRDRQPVAIAIYAIDSSGNIPISDRQIEISSIFWTDQESRDRLFSFFASHRDQVGYLKMPIPLDTNVHTWLHDAGRLESKLTEPWMVRVVDVVGALHGLPIACDRFTFALSDPYCSWNEGIFGVNGDRGQLNVRRIVNDDLPSSAINFRATVTGISALVYGTMAIDELVYKGMLTNINVDICKRLQESFTPCMIYNPFKF